jgi:hypothetical protein
MSQLLLSYGVSGANPGISLGFNPGIGIWSPGTKNIDFRQNFDRFPQILWIIAKITAIFSKSISFFKHINLISIFYV